MSNSFEIFHLNYNRFSCQSLMLFKATIANGIKTRKDECVRGIYPNAHQINYCCHLNMKYPPWVPMFDHLFPSE